MSDNKRGKGDKNLNPDEMFDTNKYKTKEMKGDARTLFPDFDSLCLLDAIELAITHKTYFVPCESRKEAQGLRLRFYKYMTKLKEANTFEGEFKEKVEFEAQEEGLLISLRAVSQRTNKYLAMFNKAREGIGLTPYELDDNGRIKRGEEKSTVLETGLVEISLTWENIPEGKRKKLPVYFEGLFRGTGKELNFTKEQWEELGDD